jgi:hypothetical protein
MTLADLIDDLNALPDSALTARVCLTQAGQPDMEHGLELTTIIYDHGEVRLTVEIDCPNEEDEP